MKIRDQIRSRREALDMSFSQLALRVDVTEQAVRHWESGRSFPGKKRAKFVEEALGIQLDWSEGEGHGERETAASMIRHADIELLIKLCELPTEVKILFEKLADQYKSTVVKSMENVTAENKSNSLQPFMTESRVASGASVKSVSSNKSNAVLTPESEHTRDKSQRRQPPAARAG